MTFASRSRAVHGGAQHADAQRPASPHPLPHNAILALQRTAGNQAVAAALARRSPAHVQRVIVYDSPGRRSSKRVSAENREELIRALVAEWGEHNRGKIEEELKTCEKSGAWTLGKVWDGIKNLGFPRGATIEPQNRGSRPTLPSQEHKDSPKEKHRKERREAIKQFSFTTKTHLVGVINTTNETTRKFETKSDGGRHAEEQFIEKVASVDLKSDTKIVITINNSPCLKRCAPALATWATENKLKRVTIFFMNPYVGKENKKGDKGKKKEVSEEEKIGRFTQAIALLQGAGIRVHGFSPRDVDEVGSDTDKEIEKSDYSKRFAKADAKVREYRQKEFYVSDEESEGSADTDEQRSSDEQESEGSADTDEEKAVVSGQDPKNRPGKRAGSPASLDRRTSRSLETKDTDADDEHSSSDTDDESARVTSSRAQSGKRGNKKHRTTH